MYEHDFYQIFRISYAEYFPNKCLDITFKFVQAIQSYRQHLLSKQKVHLLLHLVDNMADFGPTFAR